MKFWAGNIPKYCRPGFCLSYQITVKCNKRASITPSHTFCLVRKLDTPKVRSWLFVAWIISSTREEIPLFLPEAPSPLRFGVPGFAELPPVPPLWPRSQWAQHPRAAVAVAVTGYWSAQSVLILEEKAPFSKPLSWLQTRFPFLLQQRWQGKCSGLCSSCEAVDEGSLGD